MRPCGLGAASTCAPVFAPNTMPDVAASSRKKSARNYSLSRYSAPLSSAYLHSTTVTTAHGVDTVAELNWLGYHLPPQLEWLRTMDATFRVVATIPPQMVGQGNCLPAQQRQVIHYKPSRTAANSSASFSVGIKLAQPCLVTTMAPQAFPMRIDLRQDQRWS